MVSGVRRRHERVSVIMDGGFCNAHATFDLDETWGAAGASGTFVTLGPQSAN